MTKILTIEKKKNMRRSSNDKEKSSSVKLKIQTQRLNVKI